MTLKLSKKDKEIYQSGVDKIEFKNEDEMIKDLKGLFNKIPYPPKNIQFKNWSKEQIFFHMLRSERLLYFYYDKALKEDSPEILLNAYYTYNHINSTYELSSGFDHCIRLKPIMFCYAGNNYELVDKYLPKGTEMSTKGHRFNLTAVNLISGIRGDLQKQEVIKQAQAFLTKKNPKFDTAVIQTLFAILNKNINDISEYLNDVTQLHKSQKWLHDFNNPIGKYLPTFSYGLYSLAHKYSEKEAFEKIQIPESTIWLSKFREFNKSHSFREGKDVMIFKDELKCINEIKFSSSKYQLP